MLSSRSASGGENDWMVVLEKRLAENATLPKLYMTCGTEDFIYLSNSEFYEAVKNLPVDLTFGKHHGIHDWNFWDSHLQEVLKWLPLKQNLV